MNQDDLESLYKNYNTSIRRYLTLICRDEDIAEDITQDTFVRIQKSLKTYDPAKSSFSTWARTIKESH